MKKILTTLAALGMAVTLPQAAHAMDCCKDGKCACCAPKDEGKDVPKGDHQH